MSRRPIDPDQRYHLVVDPHTYVAVSGDDFLLYSTLTGRAVFGFGSPRLAALCADWSSKDRGLASEVRSEALAHDPELLSFVESLRAEFLIDLIPASTAADRPIHLPSIVRVHRGPPGEAAEVDDAPGRSILELHLYLNGTCRRGCDYCSRAYRQFPCCALFERGRELRIEQLETLLDGLGSRRITLSFLGGDMSLYSELGSLIAVLRDRDLGRWTRFFIDGLNLAGGLDRITTLASLGGRLMVLLPSDVPERVIAELWPELDRRGVRSRAVFITRTPEEVTRAMALRERNPLLGAEFRPLFDGGNGEYVTEHVAGSVERMLAKPRSLRSIFARALVNTDAFGRIVVSSAGNLHASPSSPALGHVDDCSLADAAARELAGRAVWRKTRTHVEPCKHCVFQCLCRPLDGYETALERNDLCHIRGAFPDGAIHVVGPDLKLGPT